MWLFNRLVKQWPTILLATLTLGALALLWLVRDVPLALGAIVRVDALSAFFILALLGGATLAQVAWSFGAMPGWWRTAAAMVALLVAFGVTSTLAIAGAYLLLALLTLDWAAPSRPAQPNAPRSLFSRVAGIAARVARSAPGLLAAGCLLVGYGALALRGAANYDDRTAGAALDSFAFWFVLLAATVVIIPFGSQSQGQAETKQLPSFSAGFFRFAWLYPLARLYSLGPWNSGWSFATLLFGGALALWCAAGALAQPRAEARLRPHAAYLGLALAGLGLSSSAGIAASCYGILTYLVLIIGHSGDSTDNAGIGPAASDLQHMISRLAPWLLSSAVPLSAPFVAAWMLVGASVAGGVALLAGAAWLAALLHGLAAALGGSPGGAYERPRTVAAAASLLLGVAAPLVVLWLIEPVVAQLQGGLTPYGEVNIWPWVGLSASDSAHTQVTTLPSIAIALLMLVLSALVYVLARLREIRGGTADDGTAAGESAPSGSALLHSLREEVPWLGALLGAGPREQGQRRDGE